MFKRKLSLVSMVTLLSFLFAVGFPAQGQGYDQLVYLKQLSLESLLDVEVSSVSKKNEKIMESAAAVYIITAEDIRRSGYRTLPELLRVVPGLNIANIDSHTTAVSCRGFKNVFSNKLLVLIDGRSVYTPLFSGVYWDVQDTLLEDIDRIEVIRGPGSSIWGANAVNGVINIITKSSQETQGGYVVGNIGSHVRHELAGRYGGTITPELTYRLYAKERDIKAFEDYEGFKAADDGLFDRGGFRMDYETAADEVTVQGDIYKGEAGRMLNYRAVGLGYISEDVDTQGGNLLARWKKNYAADSSVTLQSYYDYSKREDVYLDENRRNWDVDFMHQFPLSAAHAVTWGGGYRYSSDNTSAGLSTYLSPDDRNDDLYNLFVQDQWSVLQDRLTITLGVKYEHNDYTGSEWQPTIRGVWQASSRHSFWAAVSRAVRTPSRAEADIVATIGSVDTVVPSSMLGVPGLPAVLPAKLSVSLLGNSSYTSEVLWAYELGYKGRLSDDFYVDFTVFYHDYDNLRSQEPVATDISYADGLVSVDQIFWMDNLMTGESYGAEFWLRYDVADWWQLTAGYSWLKLLLHSSGSDEDPLGESAEYDDPEHQFSVHSAVDIAQDLTFDTYLYYVDEINQGGVPNYWRLDVRLAYKITPSLEWSVAATNLLDGSHPEIDTSYGTQSAETPRTVYTQLSWWF
jgi:iron complex outermembrane receptor protein